MMKTRACFKAPHLLLGALSLSLAASVAFSPSAWAATQQSADQAPAPAAAETTPQSERKHSSRLEKKPVLDSSALQAIEAASQKLDPATRQEMNKLTEAIRLEDRAVYNELRDDEENSLSDIGMLWQAAVERSGTIRYAIEKLSRRDATGKPVENDSFSKRMLQNLVRLGGVAGSMWTQSPAGLIGSNMVQDLMSGNPQDSAYSRVTDADMVILAKEVEALQSQLIELYYNYRHAQERLEIAQEARATIARYYDHADSLPGDATSQALQPLMQSILESAKQDEVNAQQAVNSSKNALALVVGPDAVAALAQASAQRKASATP